MCVHEHTAFFFAKKNFYCKSQSAIAIGNFLAEWGF